MDVVLWDRTAISSTVPLRTGEHVSTRGMKTASMISPSTDPIPLSRRVAMDRFADGGSRPPTPPFALGTLRIGMIAIVPRLQPMDVISCSIAARLRSVMLLDRVLAGVRRDTSWP